MQMRLSPDSVSDKRWMEGNTMTDISFNESILFLLYPQLYCCLLIRGKGWNADA